MVNARRAENSPTQVHGLFEMADQRQHREHRLHQRVCHSALAQLRLPDPFRGMEAGIAQDNHPPINLLNQPLKRVIGDIGGGTPPHDQSPLIEQQTEFAPDNHR